MTRSNAKKRILKELKNDKWIPTEIRNILDRIGEVSPKESLEIDRIINAASLACETPITDIKRTLNPDRRGGKHINVTARSFCFLELRESGYTLQEIGRAFGMNHTSVLHGLKTIKQDLNYKAINDKYIDFKERL